MSIRSIRVVSLLASALAASACGDGVGPSPPPTLTVAPATRSIQVGESHQFIATFRDPSDESRLPSLIHWSILDPNIASVSADGLVTGLRSGTTRVVAAVFGVADTSALEVVRTPATIVIGPPGVLAPGDVLRLAVLVRDTEGQVMAAAAISWTSSDPSVASVDGEGRLTAHAEGNTILTASAPPASETFEVMVRVPPPLAGCEAGGVDLQVGEARHFSGAEASVLCLSGGADYVLVAANRSDTVAVTTLTGEGLGLPAGGASGALLPSRSLTQFAARRESLDWRFERDLRRRERAQLNPAAARSSSAIRARQAPAPIAVNDLLPLSASTECAAPDTRVGRVQYVGERSIVVADTANPAGGLSATDYASFGATYDTLLHRVVTEHFGEPAGMNGETRVVIFYTRAVNELTAAQSTGVVGGFFWAGDLFPRSSCAGSNEREMFYMLAADPNGTINGNVRSVDYIRRVTMGTIAHELQHLVNASRRLFVNDALDWETSWLNEGMSHIAEEMVFYRAIGLSGGQNLGPGHIANTQARLDITNRYAVSNIFRLESYLEDPEDQGPFQDDDDLATRGASWQFLRYALDRRGGDPRVHLAALANSRTSGLENLEAVFGADPREWFVDDVTALYADDVVSGIESRYRHPSWNFPAIYDWIRDDFPLFTRSLTGGASLPVTLQAWGTAYVRTSVLAGRVGRVQVGSPEAPAPASLRLVLMRTR